MEEDWQQVMVEKQELDGKIDRLTHALNTIPNLAVDGLLPMQLHAMELYAWILSERIRGF